jgi:hypothetical protein
MSVQAWLKAHVYRPLPRSTPRVARQLSAQELRGLKEKLDATVAKAGTGNCDPYSRAHLADLKDRTDAALDAIVVMN